MFLCRIPNVGKLWKVLEQKSRYWCVWLRVNKNFHNRVSNLFLSTMAPASRATNKKNASKWALKKHAWILGIIDYKLNLF